MDSVTETQQSPELIFVFDHPRSCSNLFGKLFSTHPQLHYQHRPYHLASSVGPNRTQAGVGVATEKCMAPGKDKIPQEMIERWSKITYESVNNDLETSIQGWQGEDKIPFLQEHAASCMREDIVLNWLRNSESPSVQDNPTWIPVGIMRACTPVLLIRHPALAVPSFYRMHRHPDVNMLHLEDESFDFWSSYHWSRLLYDLFAEMSSQHGTKKPIVVDAENLVHNTDALSTELCKIFNIDKDGVQQEWPTSIDEPMPEVIPPPWYEALRSSTGVFRGRDVIKDREIDIDSVSIDWAKEFGPDEAEVIKGKVRAEMSAYEYLRARKILV